MVDDLYVALVLHAQLTNPIHPQYSQCFPGTNDLSNTRPLHVCIMTFEHQRTGNLPKTPTGFCEIGEKLCFEFFEPLLTQPGKSLLEIPCSHFKV